MTMSHRATAELTAGMEVVRGHIALVAQHTVLQADIISGRHAEAMAEGEAHLLVAERVGAAAGDGDKPVIAGLGGAGAKTGAVDDGDGPVVADSLD